MGSRQPSAAQAGWSSLGMTVLSCGWGQRLSLSTRAEARGDSPHSGSPSTPDCLLCRRLFSFCLPFTTSPIFNFQPGGREGRWAGDGWAHSPSPCLSSSLFSPTSVLTHRQCPNLPRLLPCLWPSLLPGSSYPAALQRCPPGISLCNVPPFL